MNSLTCDRCGKGTEPGREFDFCWTCSADLCDGCLAVGCCGKVPGRSGTRYANGLYRLFGSHPPAYAMNIEFDDRDSEAELEYTLARVAEANREAADASQGCAGCGGPLVGGTCPACVDPEPPDDSVEFPW